MWLVFAILSSIFAAFGNSNQDGCGTYHGLGNGLSYERSERYRADQPKKLDISDPFRACYWCIMALLL